MKKKIFVSSDLLSLSLRKRFQSFLEVAGRRSIASWEVCEVARADVVLLEAAREDIGRSVVILITDSTLTDGDGGALRIPVDFRVSHLMDVLDIAAIRALTARESLPDASLKPLSDNKLYRLKHWVFLGHSYSGKNFVRVLAAMSRGSVSSIWMLEQGGLTGQEAIALLGELDRRGALLTAARLETTPNVQERLETNGGFAGRLKRWIGNARRKPASGHLS